MEAIAGAWRVAAVLNEQRCQFTPIGWLRDVERSESFRRSRQATAATVEVRRRSGGLTPWALVSGRLEPGHAGQLTLEVAHSGVLNAGESRLCEGLLGLPLAVGLPTEFAQAVLDGLVRTGAAFAYAGSLRVVGGGYDDVESSPIAFEFAGGVLRMLLDRLLRDRDVDLGDLLAELPEML